MCTRTSIDDDMKDMVESLKRFKNCAPCIIVHCKILTSLYAHFHFGNPPEHDKEVVLNNLTKPDGVLYVQQLC